MKLDKILNFSGRTTRFFVASFTLAILTIHIHPNAADAGQMIRSNSDGVLAINAWGGAAHETVLRLHRGCVPTNQDCTWTYTPERMLKNDRNGLAINAWGGAQHGAELRLNKDCTSDNPDCRWTYQEGMFVSDRDQTLAMSFAEQPGEQSRTVPAYRAWACCSTDDPRWHATSEGVLDRLTGGLSVTTDVESRDPFLGFTIGMKVLLVNSAGVVVWQSETEQYGVDSPTIAATGFGGQSHRLVLYTQNLDPSLSATVAGMDIWLFHAPKNRLVDIINQIGEITGDLVAAVQNACQSIPELCHLVGGLVFATPAAPVPASVVQVPVSVEPGYAGQVPEPSPVEQAPTAQVPEIRDADAAVAGTIACRTSAYGSSSGDPRR